MKRNEEGLIEGVDYKLTPEGAIDWRAMVKPEFLVPNRQRFPNATPEELKEIDVSKLEDSEVLILLAGIKELAKLRGFKSVEHHVDYVSDDKAVVTCKITWIPNVDTNGKEEVFCDVANATTRNTNDFGKLFLESIAANRAFVRAVRNYLGVYITGADEISSNKEDGMTPSAPVDVRQNVKTLSESLGWTFEDLKQKAGKNYDVSKWEDWSDIPLKDATKLVSAIKRAIKKTKS